MPVNQQSTNRELYGILKSHGYRPDMFDSSGKKVSVPEEADAFQFEFTKDGKKYGKVTVTIDGLHRLIVYYGEEVSSSPKAGAEDGGSDISFTDLRKHLKRFAKNRSLGFELQDEDNLEADMAKRDYNKKEGLNEGYYPLSKTKSYSDNVPTTKIILQHNRVMQEGEQRYRSIEKIYVENVQGERFLLPTNKPGVARVYARHIAEGGTPYDDRGSHITSLVEEYTKMAGFVRATKGKQFNESAQALINEGLNHYTKLRETLHRMAGKKGYREYFENYTPALMEDEGSEDLSEMFMQSSLDPRIENVMPILGKLSKNINEAEINEVSELEVWADNIIEGQTDMRFDEIATNEDWQKVNKKDKTDGMSKKAVKAYRRENPGSKLQTAVTTKPSKLKKGSKSAKRRKSFCARMKGMKKAHASAKTKRNPDSPINKALRRWNCESVEEMMQLIQNAERIIAEEKTRLDPKCWTGYKKQGTKMKGGVRVNNCVPKESLEEGKPGLYANVQAKRERIKHGSGERMRKPGTKGAPTAQAWRDAAKTAKKESIEENALPGSQGTWVHGGFKINYNPKTRIVKIEGKNGVMANYKFTTPPSIEVYKKKVASLIERLEDLVTEASSPAQQAAIAVNMKKAGKKPKNIKENDLPESLDSDQKKAGQLGATDKVSTGPILGHPPQSQKGLRGKLVGGESVDPLIRIKGLSGISE